MSGMVYGKPKTAAGTWAVAVSALFLSLAAAPAMAQEPLPAAILDSIRDFGSDPDSDGLYEYLILKVPMAVERAEIYTVEAQLSILNSTPALSRASQRLYLEPGSQNITLAFPGADLARLPAGTHLAFKVLLLDYSGRTVDARFYQTPTPYSGSQFEWTPGPSVPEFTGLVLEVPEDVNADGRFGYLNITFEVRNLTSGNAEVTGTLNGAVRGTGILRWYFEDNLTALAELRFDGGAIRGLGLPGPYDVNVRISPFPGNEVSYGYRTASYNSTDFEAPGPPVAFTGNGTDAGSDQDGDGLFERLHIEVEVACALEGAYAFRAALQLPERLRPVQELLPRPAASLESHRSQIFWVDNLVLLG